MGIPVTLDATGQLLAGGAVDMAGAQITSLADGSDPGDGVNHGQLLTVPWTAETYTGSWDDLPLGWSTVAPGEPNQPGVSGAAGYLVQVFQNEDDSARVQVAYVATGGEIAIRYNLGGWSGWIVHDPAGSAVPTTSTADFILVAQAGQRQAAVPLGDLSAPYYIGSAMNISGCVYQFDTADASGSTSVELRLNGSQIAASALTVSAANQADSGGTDAARTATFTQAVAAGDRLGLACTSVGTTPGRGLRAYIFATRTLS